MICIITVGGLYSIKWAVSAIPVVGVSLGGLYMCNISRWSVQYQ